MYKPKLHVDISISVHTFMHIILIFCDILILLYVAILILPIISLFRLLDILSGKKNSRDVEGVVLVNGKKQQSDFRFKSGYVVQVRSVLFCRQSLMLFLLSFIA